MYLSNSLAFFIKITGTKIDSFSYYAKIEKKNETKRNEKKCNFEA
jgi:hypothetical protein